MNTKNIILIQSLFRGVLSRKHLNKDKLLWDKLMKNKTVFDDKKKKIEYLLNEFGTKQPCNRFDVGNCIEFIIAEIIQESGLIIEELPNAKRVDINIKFYGELSIKYSSTGDITLHNSNSSINTDEHMTDLILLTTQNIYLITNKELDNYQINIKDYLKNKGDSLKLKRTILNQLKVKNYPYIMSFKLNMDKTLCKNRLTSKLFYEKFTEDFEKLTL